MYFSFRRTKRAFKITLSLGMLVVLGLAAISYYQEEPAFSIFGRQTFEEKVKDAKANKPKAMKKHMSILEERYNLIPKTTSSNHVQGEANSCRANGKIKQGNYLGEPE